MSTVDECLESENKAGAAEAHILQRVTLRVSTGACVDEVDILTQRRRI